MITIGYPPVEIGGTEVYVAGLVEALEPQECTSEVAYVTEAPDGDDISVRSETRAGTMVHCVVVPRSRFRLETIVFDEPLRERIIETFRRLVRDRQPDVIHLHPLQLGLEAYLLDAFKREGRPLVLTYHSSTTSCARGDLVRFGRRACDGVIRQIDCTECLMHSRGVPRPLAGVLARLPLAWYRAGYSRVRHRALTKLRALCSLPLVVEARRGCWTRAMTASDRVIAVCEWVKALCLSNAVPAQKLVLSRHGLRFSRPRPPFAPSPVVRFGYVGRLSPEKGIHVLLDAVKSVGRDVRFEVEFVSATFDAPSPSPEEREVVEQVKAAVTADARLRIRGAVDDDRLAAMIATWDAMVVPSLWFESGPQVIYEAFAAGTPVVGSRRGGIAELVTEGQTGFLFEPGDSRALAALLARCAADLASLRALRSRIPAVRTTADVAADMLAVYGSLVKEHVPT